MCLPRLIAKAPLQTPLDQYLQSFFQLPYAQIRQHTIGRAKPGHHVYLLDWQAERLVVKVKPRFNWRRLGRWLFKSWRQTLVHREGLAAFRHTIERRWQTEQRLTVGWQRLGLPALELVPTAFANLRVTRYVVSTPLRQVLRQRRPDSAFALKRAAVALRQHYHVLQQHHRRDLFHMEPHTNNILLSPRQVLLIDADYAPNIHFSARHLAAQGFLVFLQSVLADTSPEHHGCRVSQVIEAFADQEIIAMACQLLQRRRWRKLKSQHHLPPLLKLLAPKI